MYRSSNFDFSDQRIPARYDERLVPVLFGPWAEGLVAHAKPTAGIRALDVATGPGTVARILARVIGPKGVVAASDASPAMITRAQSKPERAEYAPIAYTVSPATPLPYPDAAFDLVTCQQGLQFFPDGAGALAEMRRTLVRGGRLAASVWCPPEDCTIFFAYQQALRNAGEGDLADLVRIPFPRWTPDDIHARVAESGFSTIRIGDETRDLVFDGGLNQALAAFAATPIGPLVEALPDDARAAIAEAARHTFAPWTVDGVIRGPMRSWIILASA
ncbi:MAG: class I SAM-dependent methyltransferase [Gemmatimonadales bacterium]